MINGTTIWSDIEKIKKQSPLVHNITNYVVMNNTANALLSLGASPVMAHATEEVEEMAGIASSLVINMGTLSSEWVEAMIKAGKTANAKHTPITFDPVGVGATSFRNNTAAEIIEECKPTVIRGNASEIMALCNTGIKTKGVDSTASSNTALDYAKVLADNTGAIVVISGATDYITDGKRVISLNNGSDMMPKVTGMGCTSTAVIGAFTAVNPNTIEATAHAMALMSIAGEIATEKSEGPGTLQLNILDTFYNITEKDISERLNICDE